MMNGIEFLLSPVPPQHFDSLKYRESLCVFHTTVMQRRRFNLFLGGGGEGERGHMRFKFVDSKAKMQVKYLLEILMHLEMCLLN